MQGITLDEFWGYDFEDLTYLFDSFTLRAKKEASDRYIQAVMIVDQVSALLGNKPHKIFDYYPDLFKTEAEQDAVESAKASMLAYAAAWNRRNKDG